MAIEKKRQTKKEAGAGPAEPGKKQASKVRGKQPEKATGKRASEAASKTAGKGETAAVKQAGKAAGVTGGGRPAEDAGKPITKPIAKPIAKPLGKPITVHSYSGFKKDENPRSFEIDGRRLTVLRLIRNWREEDADSRRRKIFFHVHAHDGRKYTIALDEGTGQWTLEPPQKHE